VLEEHSDDLHQVVLATAELGDSLASEERYDEAVRHLRKAVELEDAHGSIKTDSELVLAESIVAAGWETQYDEALRCLKRFWDAQTPWPSSRFRALLAEARISHRTGDSEGAKELASLALDLLANRNASPFPRHQGLGLIEVDKKTKREVERLAS
jgi:tetratricopeptide (TPR) repeat protein